MVAVVAGNGLGLADTSALLLGARGMVGEAAAGRGNDRVYLNAATGNLMIQSRDEFLLGRGLDIAAHRAYNSQGVFDYGNGDNWLSGLNKRIYALTGTANTVGSTVTRADWDGSEIVYAFNATAARYETRAGAGAHDTLTLSGTSWTWTDGDTRVTETYDNANGGRITAQRDPSGNQVNYTYNASGQLVRVESPVTIGTANTSESVYLDYTGALLTQVRSVYKSAAGADVTRTRVRYEYDTSSRLSRVRVDLSPDDNAITDARTYDTSYTYDGTSKRVASISQSDGSRLDFVYTLVGATHRTTRITQTVATGVTRITNIAYNTTARTATLTDALGLATVFTYDTANRLTRITAPAVTGQTAQSVQFGYDADGNVTTVTDARGNVVTYQYNAQGLLTLQRDAAGNTVTRTYTSANQLDSETVYFTPDPDGAGALQPAAPATSRYIYDSAQRLRYVVSAQGRVTEHRYNGFGQRATTLDYMTAFAGTTYTEAALDTWRNGLGDRSRMLRTDYLYDFRGALATETRYGQLAADGTGIVDAGALEYSSVRSVYDSFGNLLQRLPTVGATAAELYVYDGLGRVTGATDPNGSLTLTAWDDANAQTRITYADNLTRTQAFNRAGELLSVTESSAGATSITTQYRYDALGRLRTTQDPIGQRSHVLYDQASRKVAEIDANGTLTEFFYDANNQLVRTLRYANAVSAAALAGLTDAAGNPLNVTLGAAGSAVTATSIPRPAADAANDRNAWQLYDSANRLLKQVDARGAVIDYEYDGASRLVRTTARATLINVATFAATPTAANATPAANANDRVTRYFYDADGRQTGVLDAEGFLVVHAFDGAGLRISTSRYADATYPTNSAQRATATLQQLIDNRGTTERARDIVERFIYDSRGQLRRAIDGEGLVTSYAYDQYGNVRSKDVGVRISLAHLAPATAATSLTFEARALATAGVSPTLQVRVDGVVVGTVTVTATAYTTYTVSIPASTLVLAANHTVDLAYTNDDGLAGTTNRTVWVRNTRLGGASLATADTSAQFDAGAGTAAFDGASVTARAASAEQTLDVNGALRLAAPAWSFVTQLATASTAREVTRYSYNATGQLLSQTRVLAGSVNETDTFTYDSRRRLTASTRASGSADARSAATRYDAFGRVSMELGGRGMEALAALGATPTQAAIDAVWNAWAVKHTYDAASRRVATTDANGFRTVFFYDEDSRIVRIVRQSSDAAGTRVGEVVTQTWNSFGEQTATIQHAKRLTAAQFDALTGGLQTAAIKTTIDTAVVDNANDTRTILSYNTIGRVATSDAYTGATTFDRSTVSYNAFGEESSRITPTDGSNTVSETRAYDKRGLLTRALADPGALALETSSTYDAFGRLVTSTDARGVTRRFTYDRAGRQLTAVDGNSQTETLTYDALGNVLTRLDRRGQTTTYAYEAFGRKLTVTTPEGIQTVTTYNAHGQVARVQIVGTGSDTVHTYDKDGNLKTSTAASGTLNLVTTNNYDNASRLTSVVDARGTTTAYLYDAANRVLTRTVDPTGLALVTRYAYDGKGQTVSVTDASGTVTATTFDAKGQKTRVAVDPTGLNLRTEFAYDKRGKTVTVTEGAGTAAARVTQYTYDKAGRLTRSQIDPAGLNISTTYAYDRNGNVATRTDARGNVTRYAYDNENRLRFTLDPTGALTETVYDTAGNVSQVIRYATLQPAATITTTVLPGSNASHSINTASIVRDAAVDRTTTFVYDRNGRKVLERDALGGVTQFRYDATGNLIQRTAYATRISTTAAPGIGVFTGVTLAASTSTDRTVRYSYDAANRLVYELDANTVSGAPGGLITHNVYDANGNVLRTLRYAGNFTIAGNPTQAQVAALLPALTATTHASRVSAREQVFAYDAANRLRFEGSKFDAAQRFSLVQHTHDSLGNRTSTRKYATAVAVDLAAAPTVASLTSVATAAANATDQTEATTYDRANRLRSSASNGGPARITDYDELGNKTRFTNEAGNVWDYAYDKAGRLVLESSPAVALASASAVDTNGQPTLLPSASVVTARILTRIAYDKMGNVESRTEAEGRPEQRVTRYAYDAMGRQITTWLPAVRAYDPDADDLIANGASGVAGRKEKALAEPIIRVGYNAFGEAVSNIDVSGNASYKAYDRLGRESHSVDAEGYVTGYVRNTFGEATSMTRYAARTTLPTRGASAPSAAQVDAALAALPRTGDRTLTHTYNLLGQRASTVEPQAHYFESAAAAGARTFTAGRTTRTEYNVFGDAVRQLQLRNPLTAEWTSTTRYFDYAGREVASIDHLGFVTAQTYDLFGNLRSRTEFERATTGWTVAAYTAPPASSGDRKTLYDYDRLNRKISETRVDARFYLTPGGAQQTRNLTTAYSYDAVGNLTRTVDALNGATSSFYDELGRVTAVISIPRNSTLDGTTLLPLTVFRRDAFANVVEQIEYAGGAASATQPTGTASAGDRITVSAFDAAGKVLRTRDATGAMQFFSYDLASRLAKQWQGVAGNDGRTQTLYRAFRYDKVGNTVSMIEPSSNTVAQGGVIDRFTSSTPAFDENGTLTGWSGTNQVKLFWSGLIDPVGGAVRVEFGYATQSSIQAGQPALVPASASRTQDFTAAQAAAGATFTWTDTGPALAGIESIAWVRVSQRNAAGALVEKYYRAPGSGGQASLQKYAGTLEQAMEYNAFGEVTRRGTGTSRQETFEYDGAGNLWRSNSGDGIDRVMLYNLGGLNTATIRAAETGRINGVSNAQQADLLAGTQRHEAEFDALGRAVRTLAPERAISGLAGGVEFSTQGTLTVGATASASVTRDESNTFTGWAGRNSVALAWNDIGFLGNGDVKVQIDYKTLSKVSYPGGQDENGQPIGPPVVTPGSARSYSTVLVGAATGATISWSETSTTEDGGLGAVTRVRVWKQTIAGDWYLLTDALGSGSTGSRIVVPAAHDAIGEVRFETRQIGSSTWVQRSAVDFGNAYLVAADGLGGGNYEYRVLYKSARETTATVKMTGSVNISAQTLAAIATAPTLGGVGNSRLLWDSAAAGITQALNYRAVGSSTWASLAVSAQGSGKDGVDVSALAAGTWEYELLWTRSGESSPYAHATGQLTVVAARQDTRTITPANPANFITGYSRPEYSAPVMLPVVIGRDFAGNPIYGKQLAANYAWEGNLVVAVPYTVQDPVWGTVTVTPPDPAQYITGYTRADYSAPIMFKTVIGTNPDGTPIYSSTLAPNYRWEGNVVVAVPYTVQDPVWEDVTITPADPSRFILGYSKAQYSDPVMVTVFTGYDESGRPVYDRQLSANYRWEGNVAVAVPYTVYDSVQVARTVTPADPAQYITGYTRTEYASPIMVTVVTGHDESGNPIYGKQLAEHYRWEGNVAVAVPYTVYDAQQVARTVTPPDPANYVISYSRAQYSAPIMQTVVSGYDEAGNPVYTTQLAPNYRWEGSVVVAVPYTVYDTVQVARTVTPPDPASFLTGYSRAQYSAPVVTGTDGWGNPILGTGYAWQGNVAVAVPYTVYDSQTVARTVTPANPANHIVGYTRAQYSAPVMDNVFTGYDESGNAVYSSQLTANYRWEGTVAVAVPYTVYDTVYETRSVQENVASQGPPVITGHDESGQPIYARDESGNIIYQTVWTLQWVQRQVAVQVARTVTPADPALYLTQASRPIYSSPVVTGTDAAGNPILATGYSWQGNVVIATPYIVYDVVQVPRTVTPANPASFMVRASRPIYAAPVVTGTDGAGNPILATGYAWQGNVVIATPYTVYDSVQVARTVTPPDPAPYVTQASRPVYSGPVVAGVDASGNQILARGYKWQGNVVVAEPYVVYDTVNTPRTVTPPDPALYVTAASRPVYGSPVVTGTDANGNPILARGYKWQGNVVVAEAYTVYDTVQVPRTVTPADPAQFIVQPSRPIYGAPVMVSTANGPQLAPHYQWQGNVVVAVPYVERQITRYTTRTVTPADPAPYMTQASKPVYGAPIMISTPQYDESGTVIGYTTSLAPNYKWQGNAVVAVPYTETRITGYTTRTVTPAAAAQYMTQASRPIYGGPVTVSRQTGVDNAGNPLYTSELAPNYRWQGDVVVAVPYTETVAVPAQYSNVGTTASNPGPLSVTGVAPQYGITLTKGMTRVDTARPVVERSFDRWGNVLTQSDPRSAQWVTRYAYDAGNRVIEETRPDQTGAISADSPVTRYRYDALGRRIGVVDARNNLNGIDYDAAGQVVAERNADGGIVRHAYDAFGNKLRTTDTLGRQTNYTYDKAGRQTEMTRAAVRVYGVDTAMALTGGTLASVTERSVYDQAGRKIKAINGNNETTLYALDLAGNIIETTQPLGQKTLSAYDSLGRKAAEIDANGFVATWSHDYFGRLSTRSDIGGAVYTFTYNGLGLITRQTNTRGQNQTFAYDGAGQLLEQRDVALNQVTRFEYDLAGQRVRERTQQNGTFYQDNWIAYDTLGRLRLITGLGGARIEYTYDAVGNRLRQVGRFNQTGTSDGAPQSHDYWFSYDSMNRQTTVEAVDANGSITKDQGRRLTYDTEGNVTREVFVGKKVATTPGERVLIGRDESGQPVYYDKPASYSATDAEIVQTYTYDAHNRLATTTRDALQVDARFYDGTGRLLRSGPAIRFEQAYVDAAQLKADTTTVRFNANGWVLAQQVRKPTGDLKYEVFFDRHDAVGNVEQYRLKNSDGSAYTNTYTLTYARFDGYLEQRNEATSTVLQPGTTTSRYDVNGFLLGVDDSTKPANNRTLINDAAGRVLLRDQAGNVQRQLIVAGQLLGQYGRGLDETKPTTDRGDPNFTLVSRFNPSAASRPEKAAGSMSYVVRAGDTLQAIAQSVYGDGRLWYRIAQANGLSGSADLKPGQSLSVPAAAQPFNSADSFKPYRASEIVGDTSPNLPAPAKKGCGAIGTIIMVVVAVVATVMTAGAAALASAGALSGASLGTIAATGASALAGGAAFGTLSAAMFVPSALGMVGASMVGAAVGSIASQMVGLAIGAVDKFSWRSVGLAALGAGVTSGLGAAATSAGTTAATVAATPGQAVLQTAGRAALGNALTQGIGSALGMQSFSWKAVAVSAVTAPAAQFAGGLAGGWAQSAELGSVGQQMASSLASGVTGGLIRAASYNHGRIDWSAIAADSFGNAIANSIVGEMQAGAMDTQRWAEQANSEEIARQADNPTGQFDRIATRGTAPVHNPSNPVGLTEEDYWNARGQTQADRYAETFGGDWEVHATARGGVPYMNKRRQDFAQDFDQQLKGGAEWSKRVVSPAFVQAISERAANGDHVSGFLLTMLKTPAEASADMFSGMVSLARLFISSEARSDLYDTLRGIAQDPGVFFKAAWNGVAENTWYENLEGAFKIFQGAAVGASVGRLGRIGALSELDGLGTNTLKVLGRYQSAYDEAFASVTKDITDGVLSVPARLREKTFVGNRVDDIARRDMHLFARDENISEGTLRINRRLNDPQGTGQYRVPDLFLPEERTIIDGTIGKKTIDSEQIRKFFEYGNGNVERVILVTPNQKPIILTLEQFRKTQK